MAWRSSGTTNDEMVDKLKRFEVISTPAVEAAFRQVDRLFFVPLNQKSMAHADQPLREGNLHISAPHMYGTVVEALELRPNSSLSFLNLGSGTGYLSCIVASILGNHSNNYGVEIQKDVVEHARESTERWKSSHNRAVPHIEWIHGNALTIDHYKGEATVGFDRIYVGSSVTTEDLPKIAFLLRPGGILVGPVEDELVKIVRIGSRSNPKSPTPTSMMETDDPNPLPITDFTQQIVSAVRFATLQTGPTMNTVLPSKVWNPSVHYQYPDSFRSSCREILLCSQAPKEQASREPVIPPRNVNTANMLPRVLWMEVLSFTHRDWFERPESEIEFLRRRLLEEQQSATRAHEARSRAEARCQMAEEERDVYRVLARRYQMRMEAVLQRTGRTRSANDSDLESDDEDVEQNDHDEEVEEVGDAHAPQNDGAMAAPAPVFGSLGEMLRSIHDQSEDENDSDDDNTGYIDVSKGGVANGDAEMEEDTADGTESTTEMIEDSTTEGEQGDDDIHNTYFPLRSSSQDHYSSSNGLVRQPRTVSITNEDL